MKKILLLSLFFLGSLVYSQESACSAIKHSKFGTPKFYCKMKDSIQEVYKDQKLQNIWNVKWLTDCKFEALCTKDFDSQFAKVGCKCIYDIVNFENDCYTFQIHFINEENVEVNIVERVLCITK
ncbi:hypothetical protein [Flavobacterium anhuiense]|uniref:hypothetical protein n=1 Tax=Flavobacterium anhuiense TaxID=459526 RepID=UPI003D99B1C4